MKGQRWPMVRICNRPAESYTNREVKYKGTEGDTLYANKNTSSFKTSK